jgi:TRAP-type C4-dicarboxylate transport system permease small subunit
MMKHGRIVALLNRCMNMIAAATLFCIMLFIVADVVLRYLGRPITGIYDLVALGGAVVIGFAIPYSAEKKVHVMMEMMQQLLGKRVRRVLYILTRLIAFGISLLVAWNLVDLGRGFYKTGEASLTIQIAFWPVAIGLGFCFALQAVVFIMHMLEGPSEEGANE